VFLLHHGPADIDLEVGKQLRESMVYVATDIFHTTPELALAWGYGEKIAAARILDRLFTHRMIDGMN
jgi:hypothetical protein